MADRWRDPGRAPRGRRGGHLPRGASLEALFGELLSVGRDFHDRPDQFALYLAEVASEGGLTEGAFRELLQGLSTALGAEFVREAIRGRTAGRATRRQPSTAAGQRQEAASGAGLAGPSASPTARQGGTTPTAFLARSGERDDHVESAPWRALATPGRAPQPQGPRTRDGLPAPAHGKGRDPGSMPREGTTSWRGRAPGAGALGTVTVPQPLLLKPDGAANPERSTQEQLDVAAIMEQVRRDPLSGLPYEDEMEVFFGRTFEAVKVFAGPNARVATELLGAAAFTDGQAVVLRDPHPSRKTVVHELTHVLQLGRVDTATSGPVAHGAIDVDVVGAGGVHQLEQEADELADLANAGASTPDVKTAVGTPQRVHGGQHTALLQSAADVTTEHADGQPEGRDELVQTILDRAAVHGGIPVLFRPENTDTEIVERSTEFCEAYQTVYLDGSRVALGRCFELSDSLQTSAQIRDAIVGSFRDLDAALTAMDARLSLEQVRVRHVAFAAHGSHEGLKLGSRAGNNGQGRNGWLSLNDVAPLVTAISPFLAPDVAIRTFACSNAGSIFDSEAELERDGGEFGYHEAHEISNRRRDWLGILQAVLEPVSGALEGGGLEALVDDGNNEVAAAMASLAQALPAIGSALGDGDLVELGGVSNARFAALRQLVDGSLGSFTRVCQWLDGMREAEDTRDMIDASYTRLLGEIRSSTSAENLTLGNFWAGGLTSFGELDAALNLLLSELDNLYGASIDVYDQERPRIENAYYNKSDEDEPVYTTRDGEGGIADRFRDSLSSAGHDDATVTAHRTAGQSTRNWTVRIFEADGDTHRRDMLGSDRNEQLLAMLEEITDEEIDGFLVFQYHLTAPVAEALSLPFGYGSPAFNNAAREDFRRFTHGVIDAQREIASRRLRERKTDIGRDFWMSDYLLEMVLLEEAFTPAHFLTIARDEFARRIALRGRDAGALAGEFPRLSEWVASQARREASDAHDDASVQRRATGSSGAEQRADRVQDAAARGVAGGGGALPHAGRIQAAFGRHDVSSVKAHVGGGAGEAAAEIGAVAYATGDDVAFAGPPDLHTAAHEAAHVVQQRRGVQLAGGVGAAGDAYERQADAVADAVVAGRSAAELLDGGAARPARDAGDGGRAPQRRGGVQRQAASGEGGVMEGWAGQEHVNDQAHTVDAAGNLDAGAGGVTRVPLRGVDGVESGEVVAVLRSILPVDVAQLDVLVHFHGGGADGNREGAGDDETRTHDLDYAHIPQQLASDGQTVGILVQARGGDEVDSARVVASVFEALRGSGRLPPDVAPGRVVISGHSRGAIDAVAEAGERGRDGAPDGLFLFDPRKDVYEDGSLWSFLEGRLDADRAALEGLPPAEQRAWIAGEGFVFRGYAEDDDARDYPFQRRMRGLGRQLEAWFDALEADAASGIEPSVIPLWRANYGVRLLGDGDHETVMNDAAVREAPMRAHTPGTGNLYDALGALPGHSRAGAEPEAPALEGGASTGSVPAPAVQRSEGAPARDTASVALANPRLAQGRAARWELAVEADVARVYEDLAALLEAALDASWSESGDVARLDEAEALLEELNGLRELSAYEGAEQQGLNPDTVGEVRRLAAQVEAALDALAPAPRTAGRDLRVLTRPFEAIPGVVGAYFEEIGDQGRLLTVEVAYVGVLPGLLGALFVGARALVHGPSDVGRLYRDVFHAMGGEVDALPGDASVSREVLDRIWSSGLADGPEAARMLERAEAVASASTRPTRDPGELERVCAETLAALEGFVADVASCGAAFERALAQVGPLVGVASGDNGTRFRTRDEHVQAVHEAIRGEIIPLVRARHQEATYRLEAIGELGQAMPVRHWIAETLSPVESPDELLNGGPIAMARLEEMAESDDLETIARVVSGAVGLVNSEVHCVNLYLENLQRGAFAAIRALEWTATTCFALLGNVAAAHVGIAGGMAIQAGTAMVSNVVSQRAQGRSLGEFDGGEILEAGFLSALAHGTGRMGGELLQQRLSDHVFRALAGRSDATREMVAAWVGSLPGDVIESTVAAVAGSASEGMTADGLLRDVAFNLLQNQLAGRLDAYMPTTGGGIDVSGLTPVR